MSATSVDNGNGESVFGLANSLITQLKQSLVDRNATIATLQKSLAKAYCENKTFEKELDETKDELDQLNAKLQIAELERNDALIALRNQFEDSLHTDLTSVSTSSSSTARGASKSSRGKGSGRTTKARSKHSSFTSSVSSSLESELEDAMQRIGILEEENVFLHTTKQNLEEDVHDLEEQVLGFEEKSVQDSEHITTLEMKLRESISDARQWKVRCQIAEKQFEESFHESFNSSTISGDYNEDEDDYSSDVQSFSHADLIGKDFQQESTLVRGDGGAAAISSQGQNPANVGSKRTSNSKKHRKFWDKFNSSLHDSCGSLGSRRSLPSSPNRQQKQREQRERRSNGLFRDDDDYDHDSKSPIKQSSFRSLPSSKQHQRSYSRKKNGQDLKSPKYRPSSFTNRRKKFIGGRSSNDRDFLQSPTSVIR